MNSRYNRCERCVTDKTECVECIENPIYENIPRGSRFKAYNPVCPRGFTDCVYDPAYIYLYHNDWYHKLYGNISPEFAIYVENGCMESFLADPEMNYYCYDDEDK